MYSGEVPHGGVSSSGLVVVKFALVLCQVVTPSERFLAKQALVGLFAGMGPSVGFQVDFRRKTLLAVLAFVGPFTGMG